MAKRFSGEPDIMYNWNNDTLFIVPLPHGRLEPIGKYVFVAVNGDMSGWLFSEHEDHPRLGTATEGLAFVDKCVGLGLIVAEADNLAVPFSSGPRRRGEYAGSYSDREYSLVLQTLPTDAELMEVANG